MKEDTTMSIREEIYLDNAATTRCLDAVAQEMMKGLTQDYGNSSSLHHLGVVAETHIKTAKKRIAKTLRCKESELLFTSGGTESDNLALRGVAHAYARTGRHIISSPIEHPACGQTLAELEKDGFSVTYLPLDERGIVRVEDVLNAVREDTILVNVMHVNNEIGSVQPVGEIGRALKKAAPRVFFHVDAVQGYGKLPLTPAQDGIDLLSVSGHKLHGPKGIGFLYIRQGVRVMPILFGGGHQGGLRSGTENAPACMGLGLAAEIACDTMADTAKRLSELRVSFAKQIRSELEGISFAGNPLEEGYAHAAPHILSMTVDGVRAEVLLHALEEKGIYVSSGSACSSHHDRISPVLAAAGRTKEQALSTIRFSFSRFTTKEELEYTAQTLIALIPMLRKFK